jgi:SAM-dependent methyltransferase
MIPNRQIIEYLSEKNANAGFIDTLKIKYRPLICPFDKLLMYAENASSVYDIGCGSGQFLSLVAKFIPSVKKLEGIEIDERLVKNARKLLEEFTGKKTFRFDTFNGSLIPENISEFEIVYLIDVMHHVPKDQQNDFIHEIYGRMSKKSKLVFKDIDLAHPFVIFNKLHDLIFSGETGRELSFKNAKSLVLSSGFKILEEYKQRVFLYPHYFIICEK